MEMVIAAAVTAFGLIIVTIIQVFGNRKINKTLGHKNGAGSITEMNEQQLVSQDALAEAMDATRGDIRAYRDDSSRQIEMLRRAVGGLTVDLGAVRELKDNLRLLRNDLDDLRAYKTETRQKVKEINHRLDEILGHDDLGNGLVDEPHGRYTVPDIPARRLERHPE